MKHVSRARGIDAIDDETGRVNETAVRARESSVRSQGHGGDAHAVFVLYHGESAEGIGLMGPARWEFGARDQVIDVGKNLIEARVNGVDIHSHTDLMRARDFRCTRNCGGVVPVDMEKGGARD